jgi:hypothetical protein
VINKATKLPVDITDYTFKFTVNEESKPEDDSNQVFQIEGVLDSVPATGKVGFPISKLDSDLPPTTYYYDVEMTTSTDDIKTIAKGEFIITMDITKEEIIP